MSRWRAYTVIGGIALATAAAVFTIRPSLTYRIIEQGMDPGWIGVVGAAYAVAPLLAAPLLGNLSDRWGTRLSLVAGTSTMTVGGLLLVQAWSPWLLLLGAVVLGLGHFLALVGLQTAASAFGRDTDRVHHLFAALSLSLSVGHILGPGFLALISGSAAVPPSTPILVTMTVALAACPLLSLLWTRPEDRRSATAVAPGWRELLHLRRLVSAVTISGLVVAAIDMTALYLPLLGSERGLSSGFVGWLLVSRAVASALVRIALNPMVDRWGARRVVVVGLALATLAMGSIAVPSSPWVLLLIMAVVGASLGVADPITGAWSALAAPLDAQGRAASLRFMANRTGQVIVPLLAAGIAPFVGAVGGFLLVTVGLGASSILAQRTAPLD